MHQLSRIALDVPVFTAAQKGSRSAESSPNVAALAFGSARMSPTIHAAAGEVIARAGPGPPGVSRNGDQRPAFASAR